MGKISDILSGVQKIRVRVGWFYILIYIGHNRKSINKFIDSLD